MLTIGSQFYTAKSKELVTVIEEPKDRGDGLYSVLVQCEDGSTRYTSVKS
jgi:hypothetical protein